MKHVCFKYIAASGWNDRGTGADNIAIDYRNYILHILYMHVSTSSQQILSINTKFIVKNAISKELSKEDCENW